MTAEWNRAQFLGYIANVVCWRKAAEKQGLLSPACFMYLLPRCGRMKASFVWSACCCCCGSDIPLSLMRVIYLVKTFSKQKHEVVKANGINTLPTRLLA